MNSKSIIRFVLLAVIALAVGGWAMKEFGGAAKPTAELVTVADAVRPDGVTVINFHGQTRCRTCNHIGALAKKAIEDHFADDMAAGEMHWEHINYEAPGNAHYVTDYELVSSTVLATRWKDGKEVKWTRLDGVWDHVNDEAAFDAYLAASVGELMNLP